MKATIKRPEPILVPEATVTVEMTETEARVLQSLLWHLNGSQEGRAGQMMLDLSSVLNDCGVDTLPGLSGVQVGKKPIREALITLDRMLP